MDLEEFEDRMGVVLGAKVCLEEIAQMDGVTSKQRESFDAALEAALEVEEELEDQRPDEEE